MAGRTKRAQICSVEKLFDTTYSRRYCECASSVISRLCDRYLSTQLNTNGTLGIGYDKSKT